MSDKQQQNQGGQNAAHVEKLSKMLGFHPSKRNSLTQEAFGDVVKEIQEERMKQVKVQAKDLLVKALDLQEKRDKAVKEFNKNIQKFDKELGGILKQISGMLSGKSLEELQEEEKGNNSEGDNKGGEEAA